MFLIPKKTVVSIFYYLMLIDGAVTEEELSRLDEIGEEIDPLQYPIYKDELITNCEKQLEKMIDTEDRYDVIVEAIDRLLLIPVEAPEDAIISRLLIWNMLVLAYEDEEYHAEERKLIKHLVRFTDTPSSVFLEMEQLKETDAAIYREIKWLMSSKRPYDEIDPIITELHNRQNVILASLENLLADEAYVPVEKMNLSANELVEAKKDELLSELEERMTPVLDSAKSKMKESSSPYTSEFEKMMSPVLEEAKAQFEEAAGPYAEELEDQAKKVLGAFKKHLQRDSKKDGE